jgi:hypothetical protein
MLWIEVPFPYLAPILGATISDDSPKRHHHTTTTKRDDEDGDHQQTHHFWNPLFWAGQLRGAQVRRPSYPALSAYPLANTHLINRWVLESQAKWLREKVQTPNRDVSADRP